MLYAAWDTIQRQDDTLRENLIETLATQLATGIEHGVTVCSTGKITRMMSTFDGVYNIEGVEKVKPMWALRDEIAGLAAKVRDAHPDDTGGRARSSSSRRGRSTWSAWA